MPNLSESGNGEWTFKKTIIRVFAYLFCIFLIWLGIYTLKSPRLTSKGLSGGIGGIVAACVYLFVDIRILILKNKRPNR